MRASEPVPSRSWVDEVSRQQSPGRHLTRDDLLGGEPLTSAEREFFEPRIGHDLGTVRIHSSPGARGVAAGLGARAVTIGADILLRDGHPVGDTREGRDLLAHELVHVVQQQGSAATGPAPVTSPDSAVEREASLIGQAVARGAVAPPINRLATRNISRSTDLELGLKSGQGLESLELATPQTVMDIASMSFAEKLPRVIELAVTQHGLQSLEDRRAELLTPESIALTAMFLDLTLLLQVTPVGCLVDFVVASGLFIASLAFWGTEALTVAEDLMAFCSQTSTATSDEDLDEAARHLADAVTRTSVDFVLAMLLHKVGEAARPVPEDRPAGGPRYRLTRLGTTDLTRLGTADVVTTTSRPTAGRPALLTVEGGWVLVDGEGGVHARWNAAGRLEFWSEFLVTELVRRGKWEEMLAWLKQHQPATPADPGLPAISLLPQREMPQDTEVIMPAVLPAAESGAPPGSTVATKTVSDIDLVTDEMLTIIEPPQYPVLWSEPSAEGALVSGGSRQSSVSSMAPPSEPVTTGRRTSPLAGHLQTGPEGTAIIEPKSRPPATASQAPAVPRALLKSSAGGSIVTSEFAVAGEAAAAGTSSAGGTGLQEDILRMSGQDDDVPGPEPGAALAPASAAPHPPETATVQEGVVPAGSAGVEQELPGMPATEVSEVAPVVAAASETAALPAGEPDAAEPEAAANPSPTAVVAAARRTPLLKEIAATEARLAAAGQVFSRYQELVTAQRTAHTDWNRADLEMQRNSGKPEFAQWETARKEAKSRFDQAKKDMLEFVQAYPGFEGPGSERTYINELQNQLEVLRQKLNPPARRAVDTTKQLGGYHGNIPAQGGEVNHIPCYASVRNWFTEYMGPAIRMVKAHHRELKSTKDAIHRENQASLVSKRMFLDAVKMDLDDIRSRLWGAEYEIGIGQMLDYIAGLPVLAELNRASTLKVPDLRSLGQTPVPAVTGQVTTDRSAGPVVEHLRTSPEGTTLVEDKNRPPSSVPAEPAIPAPVAAAPASGSPAALEAAAGGLLGVAAPGDARQGVSVAGRSGTPTTPDRELTDDEKWEQALAALKKQEGEQAVPEAGGTVRVGIRDAAFGDPESAIQALYPEWTDAESINILEREEFGTVSDPDIMSEFRAIGEDPSKWISVHYYASYADGTAQETVSVFEKAGPRGTRVIRGPHH